MADAASLIVRVKTEGAEQSAKQLDALAQSSTKADTAVTKTGADAEKASPKLRMFGTGAQQVGYQVQDMVVQLQNGTSAFVAIGQQGSQLAGAFGPGGAVLGAVIALSAAIGGVLYNALGNSTKSLEEIEKAAKELDKSFQIGKGGVLELSDSLIEMARSGDAAYESTIKLLGLQAQQQLEATTTAIKDQSEAFFANSEASRIALQSLSDLKDSGVDVDAALKDTSAGMGDMNVSTARLGNALVELSDRYGAAEGAVLDVLNAQLEYNRAATPENAQKLADAQTALAQAASKNKQEILAQAEETQKLAIAHATATEQVDRATAAQNNMGQATNSTTQRLKEQTDQIIRNVQIGNMADKERYAAQAQADKEAFAKREGVTEEQIKAYNEARDQQAKQDVQRVIDTENKKAEAEATAASKRAAAETRRADNMAAQQKKQAQTFLDTLARQNSDELAAIDEVERQKLAKLQEFQMQGAISAQQAEDAKTQIMVAAEDARQEELARRRRDAQQKQFEKEQILAEVASLNASELELVEIQEQQKASILQRYRDEGILSEEEYQGALVEIAAEANKRRRDAYASVLGQTTDDLKTALGEGNKLYKAFAVANAVMQTYQSATAAYQSAAAIPVVGFALAPVAAAAAVAAGLANVARIKSAREQGGLLSAGQMSTIAERGRPEVIMPASASRVRTAQQMRQIMGENAASSQPTTVQIVNQTTGRIDSATTERMDEATLRVIIRETVSGDLQDSNSPIAKSRRATRGQAGY
ncbi:MAG: hypothetical protein ACRCVK_21880 [Aeromonas veronii]